MQSGEACVPELLVDPCVEYSTALQLTCPQNNVDLSYLPDASDILPRARCRVCGFGQVGRDQDPRKGYYESDIYFGQNSIESVINEDPIVEYRVYLVDELNRRVTRALAVVPKDPEESQCCRVDSYRAHIFTVLPTGYKRFLVVPVSLFGTEMPAGTLSDEIEDHERGGDYDLGILPVRNFSFLVNVVDEMKAFKIEASASANFEE
ncbi:GHMP_kinases_N domain-containing protein [Durusdinium trenchii]|uniref:GHMP_kinases_N domain-containing protein n=1 Tax=Durusdinium trenchii TaxID=1381693 RepID=A0ABP0JE74_9DINO